MDGHPEAWHRLCEKLAAVVGDYLVAQIEAEWIPCRSSTWS